jgi:hypothetical protein
VSQAALQRLKERFPDAVTGTYTGPGGDDVALVKKESIEPVCKFLKDDPELAFDMAPYITAVDYAGPEPRFDLVYHVEPNVRTYEKLMGSDKVDLVLPPWGSNANFAVAPLANRFGYPFLAPTALSRRLVEMKLPYFFLLLQQPAPMTTALVDMLKANGAKTLACIYVDDLFGLENYAALKVALAGSGTRTGPLTTPIAPDEIAPTVLWMLGLPSARDMDGGPRADLLTPDAAAALPPVRWIASYGRQETEGIERAASSIDQEMLERFRSLGYIQ